jgi:hypothetical protein
MRRGLGRRPLFFLVLAFVSLVMVLPTPPQFRWVAWLCAGLAGFWSVTLAIEDLTKPHAPRTAPDSSNERENPFSPPPPPGAGR